MAGGGVDQPGAGPGEVLASQEVVHLARKVDGVAYRDRGEVHLKGLAEPVRMVQVSSEAADASVRIATFVARRPEAPPARTRPKRFPTRVQLLAAGVVLLVL